MRRERKRKAWRVRLRTQKEVLRDVMLNANECGAWLTLAELGAMTRYPAASISAQLRHLKKPEFGNFDLEKRLRTGAGLEDGHDVEWEYRLTRRRRATKGTGKIAVKKNRKEETLMPNPADAAAEMAAC